MNYPNGVTGNEREIVGDPGCEHCGSDDLAENARGDRKCMNCGHEVDDGDPAWANSDDARDYRDDR